MRKILLIIVLSVLGISAFSQQDPQFSQNFVNKLFPNPGYAGSQKAICINGQYRGQWSGFDGHPSTGLFTVHAPVKKLHGGIGLSVAQDKLGFEKTSLVKLAYAYRRAIGVGTIGIGAAVGMSNKSLNGNWNPQSAIVDASIPSSGTSSTVADFDLGVHYQTDKLYLGISATHLNQSAFKDGSNFNLTLKRHFYVTAGYKYKINENFTIKPSVFVKSDAASSQFDLNTLLVYNKMFWGGVTYRYKDAIVPMIGIKYPMGSGTLKFGYSYDIVTSDLRNGSSNNSTQTNEITLGYCFKIPDVPKIQKHKTVRFL